MRLNDDLMPSRATPAKDAKKSLAYTLQNVTPLYMKATNTFMTKKGTLGTFRVKSMHMGKLKIYKLCLP